MKSTRATGGLIDALEQRLLFIVSDDGGDPISTGGVLDVTTSTIFAPLTTYNSGGASTQGVTTGDFNGDGKPDIAFTNAADGSVGVLINKGNGTFKKVALYTKWGSNLSSILAADVTGDHVLDLIYCGDDLAFAKGNGDGTFGAPTHIAVGNTPQTVAVGDFNGDGLRDLAVTNVLSDTVSVALSKTKGHFLAAVSSPAGDGPAGLVAGDFSGDGKIDLAVTNLGESGTGTKTGARILIGQGNGKFVAGKLLKAGSRPNAIAAGDLNRDGVLDFAVTNGGFDNSDAENSLSLFMGTGSASFAPRLTYATDTTPEGVSIADVTGDHRQDVVVGNFGAGTITVFRGNGHGRLSFQENITGADGNATVAFNDFNGDAKLDLAVADFYNNAIDVLTNL